jgi:hypothetical protein
MLWRRREIFVADGNLTKFPPLSSMWHGPCTELDRPAGLVNNINAIFDFILPFYTDVY